MANKLELTWIGKEKPIEVEPRILLERPDLSRHGDADLIDTGIHDNMLIHGDNLLALKALEAKFAGQVKCIYIDPPYNTGNAFEHYDDNLEHSIWLNLMRVRLKILRNLLAEDGTIWIQIDDEEQAYLKVLCDEVFGRNNFINMVSVNMKNIAGASGGGEDKRLKKNCEYILSYAKDYSLLPLFNGPYEYKEMSELIQQYISEGKSWKYTTILVEPGEKEYFGSTIDGDGNEIKVFIRKNPIMMSVKQMAKKEGISEKETYRKYGTKIFQTTNAQSSIRTRVIDYRHENNIAEDLLSIEYIPRTGRNRGKSYEQFYKGEKGRLFVWLRDTSEVIDGELFKKDLQGTYWDMNSWMKNLTKEGNVEFGNGKKPEQLVRQIFDMTTTPGDLVLDSFLGSGTTVAVAHKMGRRWIGVEMGDHAYTHCKVRMDKVIAGTDAGGITKSVKWQGGGGYTFYELAPTLVNIDPFGEAVINEEYSPDMLAAAMALHEGFTYQPDTVNFWKQAVANEKSFLFTTTKHLTAAYIDSIKSTMAEDEYLVIACCSFDAGIDRLSDHITIKKIPQMLLERCEFGKADYALNIIHPPVLEDEECTDE
ncbi:MAG: site-specific DNA-methyltransferase [Victivallales bacterium]